MKKGFTLIEILIVVSVMMLIMISMGGIISGVFNTQNKNDATDKINQNGSWVLDELKKNILNADGSGQNGLKFNCPVGGGNSIAVTSVKDGDKTTLACLADVASGPNDYMIASISGKAIGTTVYLFRRNNDLRLTSCANFVTCSILPSLQLSDVNFNFTLQAGTSTLSSGTSKVFSADVTLRN